MEEFQSEDRKITDLVKQNEAKANAIYEHHRALLGSVKDYADDIARLRIVTDNNHARQAIPPAEAAKLKTELLTGFRSLETFQNVMGPAFAAAASLPMTGATGVMSVVSADFLSAKPASDPVALTFRTYAAAQSTSDQLRDLENKCVALMGLLHCDGKHNSAAPSNSELLREAMSLFRLPPQSQHDAGPPLFALRQCVDETAESLKRRLPVTNVRGGLKEKVFEIVKVAAKPGLEADLPLRLSQEASDLHGRLSGEAKSDSLSREATQALLSAGVNWLFRLLSAIDSAKLKPRV